MPDFDAQRTPDGLTAGPDAGEVTRRGFLSQGVAALAGVTAVAAAVSPLRKRDPDDIRRSRSSSRSTTRR